MLRDLTAHVSRRGSLMRLAATLTAVAAMLVAALIGMGPVGANTAQADNATIPVYDLKTVKVPSQYNRFEFNTNSGMNTNQVVFAAEDFTKVSGNNWWNPNRKGVSVTLNRVGKWTDSDGVERWINTKITFNDYTENMGIEYDGKAFYLSYTKIASGERFLDVTVDFLLEDGSKPGADFRGVTGFTDLEIVGNCYEAVELLSGFDGAYVRSDAHLQKYGTNAWRGTTDTNNDAISTVHGQKHYVGASFSSSTIRLKYYNCVGNGFRTSFFPAPVSLDGWSVSVSKTADKTVVPVGGEVTYTLTARNTGGSAASAQSVFDELGENLEFVEASPDGYTVADRKITWSGQTVPAKGVKTYTVKAKVLSSAGSQVVNKATTCDYAGCVPVACKDGSSCMVTTAVTHPQLTVSVEADKQQAKPGETITYTVTATNTGSATAADASVTDTLGEGLVYEGSSGGVHEGQKVTWSGLTLDPGESRTFTVTAKVADSAKDQVENTAVVRGSDMEETAKAVVKLVRDQSGDGGDSGSGGDSDKDDGGDSGNDSSDGGSDIGGVTFDSNGGRMPTDWTGRDGKLPVPTRDGYRFDGWYDADGNLIATLRDAAGKHLTARWTKLDLASTGATDLTAAVTALALAGTGVTVAALRRRRMR